VSEQCAVAGICGGCPWLGRGYAAQLEEKRAQLLTLLPDEAIRRAPIHSAGEAGLRDRTDLSFSRDQGAPVLGMYDLKGERLVDVGPCPALSAPLRAFVAEVRADPPPIERASLRLRVGPDGTRGLWIDAANVDVKRLLDEDSWLRRRMAKAIVEIGQRRKPLVVEDDRLRLRKETVLRPWFHTWIDGERTAPLYGPVGGFTQPSLVANRVLVEAAMSMVAATGAKRWLELGAGNGNFTLPLAARGLEVTAVEQDDDSCAGLRRSAEELGLPVRVVAADMHKDAGPARKLLEGTDALLADPPRSGLRGFIDTMGGAGPAHIIYVSCFAESLATDVQRLIALGYRIVEAAAVDQFPQTPHAEWILRLMR
jgi:23S rRNA (uracil1939-C5)-methyltransferase